MFDLFKGKWLSHVLNTLPIWTSRGSFPLLISHLYSTNQRLHSAAWILQVYDTNAGRPVSLTPVHKLMTQYCQKVMRYLYTQTKSMNTGVVFFESKTLKLKKYVCNKDNELWLYNLWYFKHWSWLNHSVTKSAIICTLMLVLLFFWTFAHS